MDKIKQLPDLNFGIEAKEITKALDKVWGVLASGLLGLALLAGVIAWITPLQYRDTMQSLTLLFFPVWSSIIVVQNAKKAKRLGRIADKQVVEMQENDRHMRQEMQRLSNQLHDMHTRMQQVSKDNAALSKHNAKLKQGHAEAMQRIAEQKQNNAVLSDTLERLRNQLDALGTKCESLQKSNNALKRWKNE